MDFQSDVPALFVPAQLPSGAVLHLPDEEARHVRALRLRKGDPVVLLNGNGGRGTAVIEQIDKRSILVRVGEVVFDEVEEGTYIALSFGILADKTRMEWCVEKAVELGVRELVPLETERSEGHFHGARLERIARAALKQSQRSWLPRIHEPRRLAQLKDVLGDYDRVFLCHERAPADRTLARSLREQAPRGRCLVVIGPEGGFNNAEAELAEGVEVVSLGTARLRAETAAIVAVALVASFA